MNLRYPKYLSLIITLIIVSCSQSLDKPKISDAIPLNVHQSFTFDSTFNTVMIENRHDYPVAFKLKLNDIFPLEMNDIKKQVEAIAKKDSISYAHATWKYVYEYTFWNKPYTSENWQHNPLLFLNSLGAGMCDDHASVLASLWKYWYDSVRVVGLEGHVVAEVKTNGKWQMFDADHGIAYLNDKSEVASVSELENHPEWISNPNTDKLLGDNRLYYYNTNLTQFEATKYSSIENNQDETEWHLNYANYSDTIILPPNSKIEISIPKDKQQVFFKVVLEPGAKGSLQIPFIPYKANGNFDCLINGVKNKVRKNFTFDNSTFHNLLLIEEVKGKSEIYYLINPLLNPWKSENNISIETSDSLVLDKGEVFHSDVDYFGESGLYFMKNYPKYDSWIESWKNISYEDINEEKFNQLFFQLLKSENNLSKEDILDKSQRLKRMYESIRTNKKTNAIFEKTFPKSMLYVFIAIKDDKIKMLMEE